jgi:hypothetical protein
MQEQRQNFDFLYIGVGGTGARVFESLIWLSFVGYINKESEIKFLLIDQDAENGNLKRARSTCNLYNQLRGKIKITNKQRFAFYVNKFEDIINKTYVPISEGTFKQVISDEIRKYEKLIKFLFTNEQLNFDLKDGFRGLPAIGSVSVTKEFEENFKQIFGNLNNNTHIFICGSVFGGTGASMLPTLPRVIKGKENTKQFKIMNLMVLPYFKVEEGDEKEISPMGSSFPFKSTLAFDYHAYILGRDFEKFEGVDFAGAIGLPEIFQMDPEEIVYAQGGPKQENPAHFIEALSIIFIKNLLEGKLEEDKLYYLGLIEDTEHYYYNLYDDDQEEIRNFILRLDAGLLASKITTYFIQKEEKLLGKLFTGIENQKDIVLKLAEHYITYYFSIRYSLLSKSKRKFKGRIDDYKNEALKEIDNEFLKKFDYYFSKAYSNGKTILDTYEYLIMDIYNEMRKENKIRKCLEKFERG